MFKNITIFFCLLLITLTSYAESNSNLIKVYVTKVIDGDTIRFIKQDDSTEIKGRLYGIDAPELKQDFGTISKNELSKLILNQYVYIKPKDIDRYNRFVIDIYVNDVYINELLVKTGHAWSYKQYNNNSKLFNDAEKAARLGRVGLWNTVFPIYPPDWRKLKLYGTLSNPNCNVLLNCSNLNNCKEATYLLNICKFAHLDRNDDGVPCESLCTN